MKTGASGGSLEEEEQQGFEVLEDESEALEIETEAADTEIEGLCWTEVVGGFGVVEEFTDRLVLGGGNNISSITWFGLGDGAGGAGSESSSRICRACDSVVPIGWRAASGSSMLSSVERTWTRLRFDGVEVSASASCVSSCSTAMKRYS